MDSPSRRTRSASSNRSNAAARSPRTSTGQSSAGGAAQANPSPSALRRRRGRNANEISTGGAPEGPDVPDESASPVTPNTPATTAGAHEADDPDSAAAQAAPVLLVDNKKKWAGWRKRFWTTWAMLAGFVLMMIAGHMVLLSFVFCLQCVMYYEIVRIGHEHAHENHLPGFRHLQWYWFAIAQLTAYLKLFQEVAPAVMANMWHWEVLDKHRMFILFMMYCSGVIGFVLSLKKGHYKYQFGMFAWCHVVILGVVAQTHFLERNMFEGLVWFIMPALLIINNDVWAYFFGFFFGKTPLISLSPKKTWEGFLGATFMTLFVGFFLGRVIGYFDFLACPLKDSLSFFQMATCEDPRPIAFVTAEYHLPEGFLKFCEASHLPCWKTISISPIQWHGVAMAGFASLVAPFGGFFASGFKRGFKIKDFGESIPGHGGVTDRMDCQVMMGVFAYVYYHTFVAPPLDVKTLVALYQVLEPEDKVAFLQKIGASLIA